MKNLSTLCFAFLFLFASQSLCAQSGALYTIPVVVHVIHNNGPENISDSLIRDALAEVNRNYNAQNASLAGVASPYVSITGNMQIEFCLAHTDPQGGSTTGIDRTVSPLTYYGDSLAVRMNQWPQDRYMNIWVVDSFAGTLYRIPGIGVAPIEAAQDPTKDGVIAGYYTFLAGQRGFLTNVIGHYLNLENIWGNTNMPEVACGDDSIADTPITKGNYLTCDTSLAHCTTSTIENVQNFMNWSSCTCMFTSDQVTRVHHTLNDPFAGRSNLSAAANLATSCAAPTGVPSLTASHITVSPNPFTSQINLQGLHHVEQKIVLYDMVGRIVVEEDHSSGSILHLPALAPGTYTLSVNDGGEIQSFHLTRVQ